MRKITLLLLAVLILISHLYAVAEPQTADFKIKAYKLGPQVSGEDYLDFTITDALNRKLDTVEDSVGEDGVIQAGRIDITDYLNNYTGTLPSSEGSGRGGILFSYRLSGNIEGSYGITLTLNAFSNGHDYVDASYELLHENVTFNESSTTTSADKSLSVSSHVEESFGVTGNDAEHSGGSGQTNNSVNLELVVNAEPTGIAPSETLDRDIWIARGAVNAVISKLDYDSASNGEYTANVIVTIENRG